MMSGVVQIAPDELVREARFERLIAELSMRFIDLPETAVDEEIMAGQLVCETSGIDRSSLPKSTPKPALKNVDVSSEVPGAEIVSADNIFIPVAK